MNIKDSGVSLWQFYDARTRDGIGRPRAFNNKVSAFPIILVLFDLVLGYF